MGSPLALPEALTLEQGHDASSWAVPRKEIAAMTEAERLRAMAAGWRRLAEVGTPDEKRPRLQWADYLDRLLRLQEHPARRRPSTEPRRTEH